MGLFDGIIGAVAAPLIGGLIGNKGQESANAANAEIAASTNKATMDFQERMSNTSWQRGVKDMEAAGLNPMLAYGMGGASVPSGSSQTATMHNASAPLAHAVSNAAFSAANVENTHADTAKKVAEAEQASAQASTSRSQALLNEVLARKAEQDTAVSSATASNLSIQSDVLRATVPKIVAETSNIRSDSARLDAITKKVIEETKNVPLERSQIAATIQQIYTLTAKHKQDIAIEAPTASNTSVGMPRWVSPFLPDFSKLINSADKAMEDLTAIRNTWHIKHDSGLVK